MPKNEEGEFELVVGNRQLLSVIFIMFVLFGVMFTLGYFFGRSSAPEPSASATSAKAAEGSSQRPEPSQPAAESAATPPRTAPADVPLAPGEAKVTPSGTTPVAAAKTEPPPTTPIPEFKPPAAAPPVAPPSKPAVAAKPPVAAPAGPEPGQTYLQVSAVGRPDAELVVQGLKSKGFPALLAPVPNDTQRWRALVGPLRDAAALVKARSDLQALGFKEVVVRKY